MPTKKGKKGKKHHGKKGGNKAEEAQQDEVVANGHEEKEENDETSTPAGAEAEAESKGSDSQAEEKKDEQQVQPQEPEPEPEKIIVQSIATETLQIPGAYEDFFKLPSDLPFSLVRNDCFGRYLEASRDIEPGETLLKDPAIVVGPKPVTAPVCLGCHKKVDGTYLCNKCHWPLCSEPCEDSPFHTEECEIFRKSGGSFRVKDFEKPCPLYESVLILRALLLRDSDAVKWRVLNELQSDQEHRPKDIIDYVQTNVVDFIRKYLKLEDRFSEEEIHRISGIIDINAFELKGREKRYTGIFFMSAMMAHNCITNTSHALFLETKKSNGATSVLHKEPQQEYLVIRSTIRIPKCAAIVTSYAPTLEGTLARRPELLRGKLFACTCSRCADPTEILTFFGAMKCRGKDATCTGNLLSADPLDDDADWKCDAEGCDFKMPATEVVEITETVAQGVEAAGDEIPRLEQLLKSQVALAETHYLVFGIKATLAQLYGRVKNYLLRDLPSSLLKRKEQFCKEVLEVLDIFEPGMSRIRGVILYEYHAALLMRVNNLFDDDVKPVECYPFLVEARAALAESAHILSLEPSHSAEGVIGAAAIKCIPELDEWIKNVEKLL